ncbi:CaiB/BaiF CoA transferase family protein [Robiginitomaculum antarcticum]|uniref:CaiB/BaiF CoA transferase family protein n=1 Tax=Robiginitomaculum antarcticum TaxID=437507 RepID=UPI00035ECC76|nr:CaiB/BaiF CoA-transferase family protein [Robiginitomaculum antarcticum]
MNTPLSGLKIIEIQCLGPAPFCGHLLTDLGAQVTLITRPTPSLNLPGGAGLVDREKHAVPLNLKDEDDRAKLLEMVKDVDALIEGMRPGVMERLGLGPKDMAAVNPKLVYGRVTGWGQSGPLSHAAGHDINYSALSGALWYSGQPDGAPPMAPPTLLGDIAGGALYLAIGLLSGVMKARETGKGCVVDAAMVDGSAHMLNLLLSLMPIGQLSETRGQSLVDGPHWYRTYECKDGGSISIGSIEPQFHAQLLAAMGLEGDSDFAHQMDRKRWPELTQRFATIFKSKTRSEWQDIMEGTDICFAPVLSPMQAANHPHMKARGIYRQEQGGLRAAPAPRFSPLDG